MKRFYFLGLDSIYDSGLVDSIYDEVESRIADEQQAEFWFFHVTKQFSGSCLTVALRLRSKYPEKDLQIVRVFDPVKDDEPEDWYREAFNSSFPRCIPDRNVFAPEMRDGVAQIERQFVQQANKVERWILRQVDTVIAYYYPNLKDPVAYQIEFAQRSCDAEVVHLYFDETQKFIQEQVDTLFDDRTKTILTMLQQGTSHREIGQAVGVTTSRIGQIAHKAARDIRHAMQKKGFMRQKKVERKCGLAGLSREATAAQLVIFESLLKYLSEVFNVTEFWIDKESSNSVYGAVLAKFCAFMYSSGPKAKVVVCIKEEDREEWDKAIREYVPPYKSVVNLGIESADWQSVCSEMVRQCECFIYDNTQPDAQFIRELCGVDKNTYLFDVSMDKLTVVNNDQ